MAVGINIALSLSVSEFPGFSKVRKYGKYFESRGIVDARIQTKSNQIRREESIADIGQLDIVQDIERQQD